MKTADELVKSGRFLTTHSFKQDHKDWLEKQLLDAYKAGMTEAAEIVPHRVPMLNNTYGDYVDKCLLMQQEIKSKILSARDKKETL